MTSINSDFIKIMSEIKVSITKKKYCISYGENKMEYYIFIVYYSNYFYSFVCRKIITRS